jgi:hypothetical protein
VVSNYDLFRKRIAPIAFLVAIALLARESCNKQQRIHATIVLDFGAAEQDVRGVDAEIWLDDEQLSLFHREVAPDHLIGKPHFETAMPRPDGQLRLDVDLGATRKKLTRSIHVEEGGTQTFELGADLRR